MSNAAVYSSNFTPQTHLTAGANTKGLWKFDGQNVVDASTNGNNGSLQGGATYSTDVPTGPAYHSLSVNGSTGYVQIANSTSLNITGSITVEAWIKPNSIGTYQHIVSRETYGVSGTGGGYELTLNNLGKARFDLYHSHNTYTLVIGNTVLAIGQWHHIAGVWDGSYLRLYVNGVLDATVTTGNGPASGTSSLKLGRNSGGNYFNGLIDEVRVSNAAVYSSNFTPQTHLTAGANTKGLWKFDGQSSNDTSSNGNNGTLQGGANYSDDVPSGDGGGGSGGGTPAQTLWLISDHLGTPRMIFDQTGALANMKRHDYLPFGEELFAGTGGRTTAMGYSGGDGVRPQFTQKERDIETGLDYFLARYYSSTQGRFLSPDKPFADQFQANPQSWNSYSYVRNSPCNNVDVKGRCSAPAGLKPGQVGICIEAFIAAKTFKVVGRGDNRTFSGDDAKLTAKFNTHIVITPSADKREAYAYQKTKGGVSVVVPPAGPIPFIAIPGTAKTSLNGVNSGSDGSSQTTAPVGTDGITRINATTIAENGFSELPGVDFGTIRTSINLEANVNNGQVQVDAGSQATTYPSMAIYSYFYVDGKLVTTEVWTQREGAPDDIKKPMQPIPDQTQPKP